MSSIRRSSRLAKKPKIDYFSVEEHGLKTFKANSVEEPIVEVSFESLQQCDLDEIVFSDDDEIDNEVMDIDEDELMHTDEEDNYHVPAPVEIIEFRPPTVNLDFADLMIKMTQEDLELMNGQNCSVLSVLRFLVTKEALGWVIFGKNKSQDPSKVIHSLMVNEYHRDSYKSPFVGKCDLCGLKRTICTFVSTTEANVTLSNLNCGCYCAYRLWMLYVFINMLQADYYVDHMTFRSEFLAVAYKESQVLYKSWV
ncbi:hypothetical protein GGF32_006362 [Allomyces javanicus]|nr:hypothetical protein GGF32_006362 [Allomyces javanicus]